MTLKAATNRTREHDPQVQGVISLVKETLCSDLVGVYLFGSAVLGGLKPSTISTSWPFLNDAPDLKRSASWCRHFGISQASRDTWNLRS